MTAAPKPLYIEQGATFTLGFTWVRQALDANGDPILDAGGQPVAGNPYDLTGCTARMQVRRKQGDAVLVTATSAATGPGANRIFLGGETGRIEVTLTDEDTDLLTSKTGVYDLEIEWPIKPGELRPRVDRLLQGPVTVDPNVTQVDGEDAVLE